METGTNFIQNTATSRGRTLRVEVIGEVSEKEKNFLSGISFFTAGTLGKNSDRHVIYVSGIMRRLARFLTAKIRNEAGTVSYAPQPEKLDDILPAQKTSADAEQIRRPIGFLSKNIESVVNNALAVEKAKGTRPDLVVTLACGALTITLAKLFFRLAPLGVNLKREAYAEVVLGMLNSALNDLERHRHGKI